MSIYFIARYSKYHQAIFANTTNLLTGKVNEKYNRIEYYFQLKKTNDSLVKANEALYNKLKMNYNLPDTVSKSVIDTVMVDSIKQYRNYTYLHAKVVSNSVSTQNNFIVINGPNVAKMKVGTGIVDENNGVVGIITEVSGEFAVVMSLLHKDSHISAKLLKSGETGTLNWDGKQPNIINLSNIPKGAKIAKGDTIITSGFSTTFPKGMLVGRVEEVYNETSSNNYRVRFRSAANFYNIQYVYGILNEQAEPVNKLLDKAKKQQ
jgi:rod shape-determining protein MreC